MVKKLTLEQFSRLAEEKRLSQKHLNRARRVLVEGEPIKDVAAQEGVTGEAIRKVLRQLTAPLNAPAYLTEGQFQVAVSLSPGVRPRNQELAYRVLVGGESEREVAADAGLSYSTLYKLVSRLRGLAVPRGWRVITVPLPEHLATEVERMEQEAYRSYLDQMLKGGRAFQDVND